MAPAPRRTGTGNSKAALRRKQSQREDNWEIVDASHGLGNINGDIHDDPESPLRLTSGNLTSVLHPLRALADRVGTEVETFAVKLDTWIKLRDDHHMNAHRAASSLVGEYKKIADDAVKRLRKEHGAELRREQSKSWQQKILAGIGAKPVVSPGNEDKVDGETDSWSRRKVEALRSWQSEADTWQLLSILLETLYPDPEVDLQQKKEDRQINIKSARIADVSTRLPQIAERLSTLKGADRREYEEKLWQHYATGKDIWQSFLSEDDLAGERHSVLKWLEATAETSRIDIDAIMDHLEAAADRGKGLWSQGLLDSREKIKGEKRLRSWSTPLGSDLPEITKSDGTGLMITQLDPDSSTRQGRGLEKADEVFERSVWLVLWEMLRRGKQWKEVQEWCRDREEVWRAVSVGAREPDMYDRFAAGSPLWRRICFAAARNGGSDEVERAVYGLLSGDLQSVEPACRVWDDFFYAHYNSLLLAQYDQYLQSHFPDILPDSVARKFGIFDSIQFHGEVETVGERLVQRLRTHETTANEAKTPFKVIQGSLIAHSFHDFLLTQGLALSDAANSAGKSSTLIPPMKLNDEDEDEDTSSESIFLDPDEGYALRITTHIYLIVQELGLDIGDGVERVAIENILVAYIDFLHLAGKMDLIPLYASRLSKERREITLARVLADVINQPERYRQINLMLQYDIAVVQVITKQYMFAVENSEMFDRGRKPFTKLEILEPTEDTTWPGCRIKHNFLPQEPELHEDLVIRSLEWYLMFDGYWHMTFTAGADSYIRFLRNGHLGGAYALSKRLPFERVSMLKTGAILGRPVNVFEDHEGSDDEGAPIVRRSTRLSQAEQESRSRERLASPPRIKVRRDLLKKQSRVYVELEQLVKALAALDSWRKVEHQHITGLSKHAATSAKTHIRKALDDVCSEVEPLLHDFLTHGNDEEEEADLRRIREMYLPEVVLAYNSVLHSAGHLVARDQLLQCMDLATIVAAEDSGLAECFAATGRMRDLVTAFALSSKAILRLNEASNNKAMKGKKKGRSGMDLGIWNVHADSS